MKTGKPGIQWHVKFFLCFFLMVLLPVIAFGTIASYYQEMSVTQKAENMAEGYINAIEGRINGTFKILEDQLLQINTKQVLSRVDNSVISIGRRMIRLAEFRTQMMEITSVNQWIVGIGFYYSDVEKILTNNGYYSMEFFSDTSLLPHVFKQPAYAKFFTRLDSNGEKMLSIAKPMTSNRQEPYNFSYIDVNMDGIKNCLKEYTFDSDDYVMALLDINGNVVASTSDVSGLSFPNTPDGNMIETIGGFKYISKFTPSTNLNFVCLISEAFIKSQVLSQQMVIVYICLLLLAIGVFLSVVLSGYIYNPINKIVDSAFEQLQNIKNKASIPFINDISFIGTALNEFTKYSKELENIIQTDRGRWINSVFSSLLQGNKIDAEELSDMLEYCSIKFKYPLFKVINVLKHSEISTDFSEYSFADKYQVKEILETFFANAKDMDALTVDSDKFNLCVVINHKDMDYTNEVCGELCRRLKSINLDGSFVFITVGPDVDGLQYIHRSFITANSVLRCSTEEQIKKGILYPSDIPELKTEYLLFSTGHINQLTNYIKSGDLDGILLLTGNLFENIERKSTFNFEALKGSVIQMLGIHLNDLRGKNTSMEMEFTDSIYDEVSMLQTSSELKEWLITFYTALSGKAEKKQLAKKESKVATAIEYIHAHFHEMISLTEMAEMLNTSPQHLSTIFKQTTGLNFTDYINKKRLEEAARLINDSKKNIADIALEVGYNNYNYFNKRFKEYFGVTPAQFRKH